MADNQNLQSNIKVYCAHDDIVEIGKLKPNPKNPNTHPQGQIEILAKIIQEQGWRQPIKVSNQSGYIVSGHGRYEAALFMGAEVVPVDYQDYESEAAELADLLADNRIAELAEMDSAKLAGIFADIDIDTAALAGYSESDLHDIMKSLNLGDADELSDTEETQAPSLSERFIFPPTTVLNAREGNWTQRKSEWIGVGINSEVGRDKELTFAKQISDAHFYDKKKNKEIELGRKLTTKEFLDNYYELGTSTDNSTSIFDPVLCELCLKWFSGDGSKVLDPFAGGSVRGIVSALIGKEYTGIDLRPEQIEANLAQWERIKGDYPNATAPIWLTGDSLKVIPTLTGEYDMIFSCPPYADLEKYSDDPADLSNMEYDDFLTAYREIIRLAAERLKENRFAVFVVGEVRDKRGNYISFVPDTIKAFTDAGLHFYNEGVLVTQISGLRYRLGKQFTASRKLGKTHQNILVFVKGDAKKATAHCGDVSADMPTEYIEETEEITNEI